MKKEYNELKESELGKRITLQSFAGAFGATWNLVQQHEGYYCAGSAAVFKKAGFIAEYLGKNGYRGGQYFETMEEALSHIKQYTTPIVEVRNN